MVPARAPRLIPILLILIAAVAAPPILTGYRDVQLADTAMTLGQYSNATRLYGVASRLLPWRADLWEKTGSAAYALGDQKAAIRLLSTAARRELLSARGWDELGTAYWTSGNYPVAISSWVSGSHAYPDDAALLDRLAAAYHQQADYDAEQVALEQRLRLGEDAGAHYRLGLLLLLSDGVGASQQFQSAAALDTEFEPATSTLLAAWGISSRESDPGRAMLILGRALGLVEEWSLAARQFGRAVYAHPQNAEAWAWLGESRQHIGQDGLPELDRALALGPRDSTVHILRGLYFRRQEKNSQAIGEYLRAADLEPGNPAVQSSLGEAYAASGDLVAALAPYQKATLIVPADATYWRLLALFCADNSVQVAEIGLPAAQKAAEFAPKDPEVLDALGWSYAQAGYYDQAEKTLQRAFDTPPALASAHVHLAVLYLRLGENTKAFDQLKLALHVDWTGPAGQSAVRLLHQYFPSAEIPAPSPTP